MRDEGSKMVSPRAEPAVDGILEAPVLNGPLFLRGANGSPWRDGVEVEVEVESDGEGILGLSELKLPSCFVLLPKAASRGECGSVDNIFFSLLDLCTLKGLLSFFKQASFFTKTHDLQTAALSFTSQEFAI